MHRTAEDAESRRTLPLPAFVVEAVAEHLAAYPAGEDGLILQADKGGAVLRTTLAGRWQQTLKRAALPSTVHLRHLRHGDASLLNDAGVPFTTVMVPFGHAPQG